MYRIPQCARFFAVAALMLPGAIMAGPIYTASGGGAGYPGDVVISSDPVVFDGGLQTNQFGGSAHLTARAGQGTLGAKALNANFATELTTTASMEFHDLIFTGPGDGPIATSFQFALDGSMVLSRPGGIFFAASGGTVTVFGLLNGQNLNGVPVSGGAAAAGGVHVSFDQNAHPTVGSNGLLSGFGETEIVQNQLVFTGSDVLQSIPILVPLDQPVSLYLALRLRAALAGNGRSELDFSNSLTFPTTGPVFALPEGYTVHSASAGIVDNVWIGAIPEPSSVLLLGAGALGLAARLRWKRRTGPAGRRASPPPGP